MSNAKTSTVCRVLARREYDILKSIAERILPEAAESSSLDLALQIDLVLADMKKELRREFKFLLLIFEYAAPILGGMWKRFTRMDPSEKDRYLAGWERSRISFKRMGFQVLKRLVLASFYGSEASWNIIGYRGPWLDKGYPHDYQGKGIKSFPRN